WLVRVELSSAAHMALEASQGRVRALADRPLGDLDETDHREDVTERFFVVDEFVLEVSGDVVEDEARQRDVGVLDERTGCPGEIAALQIGELFGIQRRDSAQGRRRNAQPSVWAKDSVTLPQAEHAV